MKYKDSDSCKFSDYLPHLSFLFLSLSIKFNRIYWHDRVYIDYITNKI